MIQKKQIKITSRLILTLAFLIISGCATIFEKPKPIPIEGKFFNALDFAKYVKNNINPVINEQNHWKPSFIVLHNTSSPTIAQRPKGFNQEHMQNFAYYYGVDTCKFFRRGCWPSGPHLFVDQNGIWVFSNLTNPGTHSPSWNNNSWGIEQLGEFDFEEYDKGEGKKIKDNAIAAIAILSNAINIEIDKTTLRLHKEDPATDHNDCPGKNVHQDDLIKLIKEAKQKWSNITNAL